MESDLQKMEEGIISAKKSRRAFSFDFNDEERTVLSSRLGLEFKIEDIKMDDVYPILLSYGEPDIIGNIAKKYDGALILSKLNGDDISERFVEMLINEHRVNVYLIRMNI